MSGVVLAEKLGNPEPEKVAFLLRTSLFNPPPPSQKKNTDFFKAPVLTVAGIALQFGVAGHERFKNHSDMRTIFNSNNNNDNNNNNTKQNHNKNYKNNHKNQQGKPIQQPLQQPSLCLHVVASHTKIRGQKSSLFWPPGRWQGVSKVFGPHIPTLPAMKQ